MSVAFDLNLNRSGDGTGDYRSDALDTPAILRFSSDFQTGSIEPFSIKNTDSVLCVFEPAFNKWGLRFSLATYLNPTPDPKTGKLRNDNPVNFNLDSKTANESRGWNAVSIEYYLAFDDADNRDADGVITRMKLGYFSDLYNDSTGQPITSTQCAIYPVVSAANGCGIWALERNNTSGDPAPAWSVDPSIDCNGTNRGLFYNGHMNKIQLIFDNIAHTFEMWVNDIKVLCDSDSPFFGNNGVFPILDSFRMGQFSAFHAAVAQFSGSTARTGVIGGGAIYDFKCYQGRIK